MGKLIDADALKERIRRFLSIKSLDDLLPEEKAIVQHIDRMPPVDAVPVRHGYWIRHNWAEEVEGCLIPNYECSVCHTWKRDESDYCPDCGARMDGKDGDSNESQN